MKKEERDQVIDLKLGELGEKRLKLQTELAYTPEYFTNMKIQLPGRTELTILRTVKDEKKLILLLGELLSIKNKWELGYKECYPKAAEVEDFEICGFSIMSWISDVKNLIEDYRWRTKSKNWIKLFKIFLNFIQAIREMKLSLKNYWIHLNRLIREDICPLSFLFISLLMYE